MQERTCETQPRLVERLPFREEHPSGWGMPEQGDDYLRALGGWALLVVACLLGHILTRLTRSSVGHEALLLEALRGRGGLGDPFASSGASGSGLPPPPVPPQPTASSESAPPPPTGAAVPPSPGVPAGATGGVNPTSSGATTEDGAASDSSSAPSGRHSCAGGIFLPPVASTRGKRYYGLKDSRYGEIGVYAGWSRFTQLCNTTAAGPGTFIGGSEWEDVAAWVSRSTGRNVVQTFL